MISLKLDTLFENETICSSNRKEAKLSNNP